MHFSSQKNTPLKQFNILMKDSGQTSKTGKQYDLQIHNNFQTILCLLAAFSCIRGRFQLYHGPQNNVLCVVLFIEFLHHNVHSSPHIPASSVAKIIYVTKSFGQWELSTVLHQNSSSSLPEFCLCFHAQTIERKSPESQTFLHMQAWVFPKCYFSWKLKGKLKGSSIFLWDK